MAIDTRPMKRSWPSVSRRSLRKASRQSPWCDERQQAFDNQHQRERREQRVGHPVPLTRRQSSPRAAYRGTPEIIFRHPWPPFRPDS